MTAEEWLDVLEPKLVDELGERLINDAVCQNCGSTQPITVRKAWGKLAFDAIRPVLLAHMEQKGWWTPARGNVGEGIARMGVFGQREDDEPLFRLTLPKEQSE